MRALSKILSKSYIAVLSFAIPLSVQAATLDDVVKSIDNVWTLISSSINAGVITAANFLYEPDPNLPSTVAVNAAQNTATASSNSSAQALSLSQTKQALGVYTTNSDETNPDRFMAKLLALPGSDSLPGSVINVASITGQTNAPTSPEAGNVNYDFASLINPITYTINNIPQANNFVQLSSGLYDPISTIPWYTLTAAQKKSLDTSQTARQYRLALRSLVAARSVGIADLDYLIAERTSVPGLGTQAGLANAQGQAIPDTSPLQVQEYTATHRVNNPNWYIDMTRAAPATIAREQLFVMAEIQRQLYQMHRDNERILATLAMLELQSIQNNKPNLQVAEQKLRQELGIATSSTGDGSSAAATLAQ